MKGAFRGHVHDTTSPCRIVLGGASGLRQPEGGNVGPRPRVHRRSVARYTALYARSPHIDHQQRYHTLTGANLPDPPPLPDPPAIVTAGLVDVDMLAGRVAAQVARRQAEEVA